MSQARYPKLLLVKVSPEMDAAIHQLARQDDRSLSGTARRLLAEALASRDGNVR